MSDRTGIPVPLGDSNPGTLLQLASEARLALHRSAIHTWMLSRQRYIPNLSMLFSLLTIEEQHRAISFHTERLYQEFVIARALLKIVLAGYCACGPEQVRFVYGVRGKPEVDRLSKTSKTIAFNLSHSADSVLIGISTGAPIGVDIEEIHRGKTHIEAIASSFLNSKEVGLVNEKPIEMRIHTLLRYWTHKEAYLKAIGCGLIVPLPEVDVQFLNLHESLIRQIFGDGELQMFGQELACGECYIGALASPMRPQEIMSFS